jgi:SMI1 / KNR4 family (SUKH-1)
MRWQPLFDEIRAQKLDLARLDPQRGAPPWPPPGASASALAAAERRLGRALPPSYRELLGQCDGVPGFYQGAGLLSTRHLARGTYVDLCRIVIDVPTLVPFGVDPAGETIFAWDPSEARGDGEIGVVVWMNEIGERLRDFPSFLELVRDMLAAELADRRARSPSSRRLARVPERAAAATRAA